ncbi:phytanoyl-CoA dioxygenase family protein [Nisaea nitritireducens]|uniref:phytanoyl-CoA dioxygenase family protein n=1 Tax=Nisaea nitritireducens TaxID=568392 RepID=UPI001866A56A|nr:phytanoyl-CoA dioxygenase family protein [Nisaea nitritireducens]
MIDFNAYDRDGFAVTAPIFGHDDLTIMRAAVHALHLRALGGQEPELSAACVFEKAQPARKRDGRELPDGQDAVFILGDPTLFDPGLLRFIVDTRLTGIVEQVLGTPDIVLHFANITTKAPEIGSGISWHRDFPNKYMCPAEPKMVRMMICLDGMQTDSGATAFLAGSHTDDVSGSDTEENDPRLVAAECAPGSVVAIHPLVLHGGAPNASALQRRNLVLQWGIADCPLVTEARESMTGMRPEELRAPLSPQ